MPTHRRPTHVLAATDTSVPQEHHGLPVEQQLIGTVHFNDGARLTVEAGRQACSRLPLLRAHGTTGFADLRMEPLPGDGSIFRAVHAGQRLQSPATNEHFHHSEDGVLYIHRALLDIVAALNSGSPTRIDAEQALASLEILIGLFESARLGRMLSFPITQERFPPLL